MLNFTREDLIIIAMAFFGGSLIVALFYSSFIIGIIDVTIIMALGVAWYVCKEHKKTQ